MYRVMWFCCVSIGAVTTMVIIVSLWEKFQTNPTITGLDTDFHNWDLAFPAVTLCQSVPSSKENIQNYIKRHFANASNAEELTNSLRQLTLLSADSMVNFKSIANKGYISNTTSIKQLIFQLITPCQKIFERCQFKTAYYDCCEGFFPIFTENGVCYTFNSRHYERKVPWSNEELPPLNLRKILETDMKWSLKFEVLQTEEDIKFPVYIHDSNEIPGLDMQPQIIWNFKVDKVAFSMKQTYTTDDTRQLSIRQRHCIFSDEVKLKIDHMYTYTACTRQCRMENAKKFCGCVPHFYAEMGQFRHCKINELACIADNINDIKSTERCPCKLGCYNTVYDVEKFIVHNTEDGEDNRRRELEVEFVSWPMVRYKREVLFGWVDLLVSFGGIAGLFLGFSLLSGVELIYYFTMRACCMIYREPRELERLQRQEIVKPKPNYDLSLIPYFVKPPSPSSGIGIVAGNHYGNNLKLYTKQKVQPIKRESIKKPGKGIQAPFGIEFLP
ncbi:sodium channel protein Nach-like [Photinus pyralis]|uniref:sodium channel protein Nach-like n=1 Tax=Photinus pyralis TaxID=7054 RepID=UPI001266FE80|nr:sodium channel protein Nach-like [Photinus pyralis]